MSSDETEKKTSGYLRLEDWLQSAEEELKEHLDKETVVVSLVSSMGNYLFFILVSSSNYGNNYSKCKIKIKLDFIIFCLFMHFSRLGKTVSIEARARTSTT